ncbi:MAG: hypothetical protein U0Z44_12080 [Kouleothrix sp.]
MLIVYMIGQRWFIRGIAMSGMGALVREAWALRLSVEFHVV